MTSLPSISTNKRIIITIFQRQTDRREVKRHVLLLLSFVSFVNKSINGKKLHSLEQFLDTPYPFYYVSVASVSDIRKYVGNTCH
jgi:hypothetical protein